LKVLAPTGPRVDAGRRPVTIATTSPTRGDDTTDRYVVDPIAEEHRLKPFAEIDGKLETDHSTIDRQKAGPEGKGEPQV
jgi:hypothetical protein